MKNKIGIIGGSGAFATSHLLQKINEYSVTLNNALDDADFLNTVIISTPYNYLNFKGESKYDTYNNLLINVHDLEKIGCNIIVFACNTLYQFFSRINNDKMNQDSIILNLPQLVCHFIDKEETKIGILCSEKTRELNIYQPFLNKNQKLIYPTNEFQQSINYCIRSVIQNKIDKQTKQVMDICLLSLFEQNVDSVIIGCTELSIIKPQKINKPIYDSVDLLAIFLNTNLKEKNESL